jgi:hypothetical protein
VLLPPPHVLHHVVVTKSETTIRMYQNQVLITKLNYVHFPDKQKKKKIKLNKADEQTI